MNNFGVDYRGGSGVLFRTFLQDSGGALVTSGNVSLFLQEPQNDGSLYSYDFNSNVFTSGALVTQSAAMTHRKTNGNTRDTGLWTYVLSSTSGITPGNLYIIQTSGQYASPIWQSREFQFGSGILSSVVNMATGVIGSGNPVTLATSQPNYAPAKTGEKMDLIDNPNLAAQNNMALVTAATTLNYDTSYFASGTTIGRAIVLGGTPIGETTVSGVPTVTGIRLTDGSSIDDYYNDMQLFLPPAGSFSGQSRIISQYIGSGHLCIFDEPFTVAPASGDRAIIKPVHTHTKNQLADAILTRDFVSVTGEASRSLLNSLRFLRNNWYITGSTLFITKEDDTTIAWSGLVTTGNGSGVAGMDPV